MRARPAPATRAATKAVAAIGQHPSWQGALAAATSKMPVLSGDEAVDLAFLFASSEYADEFADLLASAREATRARVLVGCSSQGVIGPLSLIHI